MRQKVSATGNEVPRELARQRRLPVGAEVVPGGGVHFRVWSPRTRQVQVVLEGGPSPERVELRLERDGHFGGLVANAGAGTLYRYLLDGEGPYPDPASRFQPDGPHGPSQVVDPSVFEWTDEAWRGTSLAGQVIYEMHVGTFTREGTWRAATEELPELAEAGITLLELMPVADFPGRFGWGYDGVNLFAPTRLYGKPDDFRRFVDSAHALGLGVILDVVYNHLGPEGNYLKAFSESYFTDRYENEWGEPLNFDGQESGPVREFFIANAGYWIDEFHIDGMRLDATQQIFDASPSHILTEITARVRESAGERGTVIIAENEPQQVKMVRAAASGGHGMDGMWNDDFHHSAVVALTGRSEAYYTDYHGSPQELISLVKWGFLYQGQRYSWQRQRRGTPTLGLPAMTFVNFLQNHDQVANSARGERIHALTSPGRYRALTALLLLGPGTPMLFQGQEFASSSPFLYFADYGGELARQVRRGRAKFLEQFRSIATPEMQAQLPNPSDPATFARSKLDLGERERHGEVYRLHRDLLKLRRDEPVFRSQDAGRIQGAVLGPVALVLRFFGENGDDRLLLVNLDRVVHLDPAPEPLLAPPENKSWEVLWSSEDPKYGGLGTPPLETDENWWLPAHAAVVLRPRTREMA